jgi:hypothetical protein
VSSWIFAVLVACNPQTAPAPAPATLSSFVALSPNNSATPPRNECWMAGRFEGMAYLLDDQVQVVIPRAWIAVTRDNDKEWDELRLVIQLGAHPLSDVRWKEWSKSIPVILQPTVDSAGPQLTTWETQDTLRLFVPWKQGLGPRWLLFRLNYSTLSHHGQRAECDGSLGSDTLRFR